MQPIDVVAATLAGEGRNRDHRFRLAVAVTIHTRTYSASWKRDHRSSGDVVRVCTAPWQFSCWNANDPNRDLVVEIATRKQADQILAGGAELVHEHLPTWLATCYAIAELLQDSGPAWSLLRGVGSDEHVPRFDYYHHDNSRPRWLDADTVPTWRHGQHQFYSLGPDGVDDTADDPR